MPHPKPGELLLAAARVRADERSPAGDALADRITNRARSRLDEEQLSRVAGGELITSEEGRQERSGARNTTLEPDQVAADASRNRLDLA